MSHVLLYTNTSFTFIYKGHNSNTCKSINCFLLRFSIDLSIEGASWDNPKLFSQFARVTNKNLITQDQSLTKISIFLTDCFDVIN